ncbi:MAG TPA: cupin domain-containing protein [Candidatus Acidoferrales bacterium]|nr:cupin domain-containing protein [Candidatus Acidoferrales bacterium]
MNEAAPPSNDPVSHPVRTISEHLATPAAGGSVQAPLEWLIQPTSRDRFFKEYFEKQPLLVRRQSPDYYASLLSLDEVDRVLTTLDLRYPNIILKNAARSVEAGEYTINGSALDIAKVYQLFAEGSTITLAYLDTVVPALTSFCRGLESEFSCPFQANVYLTPPGNQGAKIHYDTHDVFVLQVAGTKRWTLYGTPIEVPLRDQDYDPAQHAAGAPTMEFELSAGDLVYIPRGCMHDARSTDTVSLHITVGILAYTWTDLLLECVAEACLNNAAFRKSLPPGFARDGFPKQQAREIFSQLVQHLAERARPDEMLDRFADELLSSCPPLLRGQMEQLAALDRLAIDSIVERRTHLIARVQTDAGSVSVRCFGRNVRFPAHAAAAVQFALSHDRFAVRDLPGELDESGKLTLVRRMIREGLLAARIK